MNHIQKLHVWTSSLQLEAKLFQPVDPKANWKLYIFKSSGFCIEVTWRAHLQFGVSAANELAFGLGPDELYPTVDAVQGRIAQLLKSEAETSSDHAMSLSEIRLSRGSTQTELAKKLGIDKTAVAKREAQNNVRNMQVETLDAFARALNGTLKIAIEFADGTAKQIDPARIQRTLS
jgi:DNA-binding Xre family transcriptional regulator